MSSHMVHLLMENLDDVCAAALGKNELPSMKYPGMKYQNFGLDLSLLSQLPHDVKSCAGLSFRTYPGEATDEFCLYQNSV